MFAYSLARHSRNHNGLSQSIWSLLFYIVFFLFLFLIAKRIYCMTKYNSINVNPHHQSTESLRHFDNQIDNQSVNCHSLNETRPIKMCYVRGLHTHIYSMYTFIHTKLLYTSEFRLMYRWHSRSLCGTINRWMCELMKKAQRHQMNERWTKQQHMTRKHSEWKKESKKERWRTNENHPHYHC